MNPLARITIPTRRLALEKYTSTPRQTTWSWSPRAGIRGISSAPAFGFNAPASRTSPSSSSSSASVSSSQAKGPEADIAEEMPVASFRELNIGRKTKIFLFTVLGVFGTLETWFWVETIYRWWRGDVKEDEGK